MSLFAPMRTVTTPDLFTIRTPDGAALIGLFRSYAAATATLNTVLSGRGNVVAFPHATTYTPEAP